MAFAFYYYNGAGGVEKYELGATDTLVDIRENKEAITSESISGPRRVSQLKLGEAHTLEMEITTLDNAGRRAMENVANAIRNGQYVGFTLDDARAWFGYLRTMHKAGDTVLEFSFPGNLFWERGVATLSNGDQIVVETPHPDWVTEHITVSEDVAVTEINVDCPELIFSHQVQGWARWYAYWPVLRGRADSTPETDPENRLYWRFRFFFWIDTGTIEDLRSQAESLYTSEDYTGAGLGSTMDDYSGGGSIGSRSSRADLGNDDFYA